ncbi:LOB domain-containing protein 25-like [Impatiens glandulifera]|uniref:LOB domain-containing protein 25-like n=1 Tax=Impatiens glandulifera TaxID=253017 RepID=UPI001FB0A7FA|nr:LOB domain-containing protein 25-like [Impatiens glandulifera]
MASSSYNSPCAACKFLRRKCVPECIFAPYFPPEEPQKFANVHKIFGASNVAKHLNDIPPHQRDDAVCSLAYEAEARVRDPVYGCVGAISFLQTQIEKLQKEIESVNADLIRFAAMAPPTPRLHRSGRRMVGSIGSDSDEQMFYQTPPMQLPCCPPPPYWMGDDHPNPFRGGNGEGGGGEGNI